MCVFRGHRGLSLSLCGTLLHLSMLLRVGTVVASSFMWKEAGKEQGDLSWHRTMFFSQSVCCGRGCTQIVRTRGLVY